MFQYTSMCSWCAQGRTQRPGVGGAKEGQMSGRRGKRLIPAGLLALAAGLALAGLTSADNPNERTVKPQTNVQDTDDITKEGSKVWVLDFKFKDPRLITVDVPGRGRKVCWYLWYQVTNNSEEPRMFIPDFELVTNDTKKVHADQILPAVERAIRKLEDPTENPDNPRIKNSVTISANPIPPSKLKDRPNAVPRPVTGVAIWDDVDPESNNFSIFIAGLSNGWSVTDPIPPDTKPVVRRKTLQLNFKRLGDKYYQKSEEIRFVAPEMWIYRGSQLNVPGLPAKPEAPKEDKPKADK
jgi:hypothetical protein